MPEGPHSRDLGLLVGFHFFPAKLEGRHRLHGRDKSSHSTWAAASIPFSSRHN